jgi:prepilin-type processing-associated H-X9-DG protein
MIETPTIIQSKLNEISDHGYVNNFSFADGHLVLKQQIDNEEITKSYIAEQISVEAEYLFEEKGSAIVTFMTNDGIMGYSIDKMDSAGEFPLINYIDSLDD